MVEIDLTKCTLTELLDLIGGGTDNRTMALVLKKVVVGGTDKLTGAQLKEVVAQLAEAIKADMLPKETA